MPSIEHGKYYEMPSSDPIVEQIRPTTSPLVPMDKIDSGISIAFQCDSGYNIQVHFIYINLPSCSTVLI